MNLHSRLQRQRHLLAEWLPESLLIVLVLAFLIAMLVACATVDAMSTPYIGAPHPPPTDPARVEILHAPPTQPHDGLGQVVVDASTEPAPPITQIEDKLRTEAAKLGADAIVIVSDQIQPTGVYVTGSYWGRSVDPVIGRRIVGVAVKYRT
jgi:hypothetical protein